MWGRCIPDGPLATSRNTRPKSNNVEAETDQPPWLPRPRKWPPEGPQSREFNPIWTLNEITGWTYSLLFSSGRIQLAVFSGKSPNIPSMSSPPGQTDTKTIPTWHQTDARMMPKWCQNDAKIMPKWCQNDARMIPKWCHNETVMPTWCQNDAKIMNAMPKWCQHDANMIPNWFQNDA